MNICIFGDSITWGAYDPAGGGWAMRLRNFFEAQDNGVHVYNCGVSGDTTADVLERIEAEAKSREADMIIFAIGINDAQYIHSTNSMHVPPDEFEKNIAQLFTIGKKFTNKIMFVGLTSVDESQTRPCVWNSDKSYRNENIEKLDGVIKNFCANNNVPFISMQGIIGSDDLDDGLHPNTNGHMKIFDRMKLVVESNL